MEFQENIAQETSEQILKESFQQALAYGDLVKKLDHATSYLTLSPEEARLVRRAYTKMHNKILSQWKTHPEPFKAITPSQVLTHLTTKQWNSPIGEEKFSVEPHTCDQFIKIIVSLAGSISEPIEEIAPLFSAAILNVACSSPKKPTTLFGDTTKKTNLTEKQLTRALLQNSGGEVKRKNRKRTQKQAEKEARERRAKERKDEKEQSQIAITLSLETFDLKAKSLDFSDPLLQSLVEIIHNEFHKRATEAIPSLLNLSIKTSKQCFANINNIGKKEFSVPAMVFSTYRDLLPSMGRYPERLSEFATFYGNHLEKSAKMTLEDMNQSGYEKTGEEVVSAPYFNQSQYFSHGLLGLYIRHGIPSDIHEQLIELIPLDPKDEYPRARELKRHFIIHVGSTNTGKTYEALQCLKQAESGVYLSPLRLLALEVQENLRESGVICGLLTGEEEDLSLSDTHMASTVEKLNLYQKYDVAVLDECQMINDPARGFAWTRAILGCLAPEIHCCVAPEGLEILTKIINHCGDSYHIKEHKRKVPLTYEHIPVPLEKAKKGDAYVAFSRKSVLYLAQKLINLGFTVSVIYGALPYQARRAQMNRFLEGESHVLVATDAIGMGLNLPIRRIIFTADAKFDGIETRQLLPGEVKQIGGRAGRFGQYDEGFVCRSQDELDIKTALTEPTPILQTARLGFSELILSLDFDIVDILKVWQALPDKRPFVKMDIDRYLHIIARLRDNDIDLKKEDLLKASLIPFDEKSPILWTLFIDYILCYTEGESIEFPCLFSGRLVDLELYVKKLDLYYSFCKHFGYPCDLENLAIEKEKTTDLINENLIALRDSTEKNKKQKNKNK